MTTPQHQLQVTKPRSGPNQASNVNYKRKSNTSIQGMQQNEDENLLWCNSKIKLKKLEFSQWTGFEPVRAEPNWFLVNRLNHSATTAGWS